jgi:hypothetical protein
MKGVAFGTNLCCCCAAQIMSYVDLAESQYVAEKFIIQSVRDGINPELLKRLFTPFLDKALDDKELVCA